MRDSIFRKTGDDVISGWIWSMPLDCSAPLDNSISVSPILSLFHMTYHISANFEACPAAQTGGGIDESRDVAVCCTLLVLHVRRQAQHAEHTFAPFAPSPAPMCEDLISATSCKDHSQVRHGRRSPPGLCLVR